MSNYKNVAKLATLIKALLPTRVASFFLQHPIVFRMRGEKWRNENPFRFDKPEWFSSCNSTTSYKIGIIKEFCDQHWPFIAACRDLDVSYEILDISGEDWLDVLVNSNCDAFLCRPSVQYRPWKEMYDEKLRIFSTHDSRPFCPDLNSLWIWESKRRMNYWLKNNNVPHPRTWVFYNIEEAQSFISACDLPIVFKSDMGSGASGVKIIKKRKELQRLVSKCFSAGYTSDRRVFNDKELGFIIFQEYLPNVREWRTARLGDSYFAYEKGAVGGIHSGSKSFIYGRPPDEVLNLLKETTDKGNFESMNVDIFQTDDGRLLVNELQAIFGQARSREICRVDGKSGRMIFDNEVENWEFEEGTFCQNYMCNLRVKMLLEKLNSHQDKKL